MAAVAAAGRPAPRGRHPSRRDGRAGSSSAASAGSTCSSSTPRSASSATTTFLPATPRASTSRCSSRSRGPSSARIPGTCAPSSTSCASTATTSRSAAAAVLLAPADLAGLVEVVIDRYQRDYELDWPGLVGAVLGPLRRPGRPHRGGAARPARRRRAPAAVAAAARSGSLIGDFAGRLRLSSTRCRRPRRAATSPTRPRFTAGSAALFAGDPCSPRAIEELPWQLLAAGDRRGPARAARRPAFIEAAYDTDRSAAPALGAPRGLVAFRAATAYAPFAATRSPAPPRS